MGDTLTVGSHRLPCNDARRIVQEYVDPASPTRWAYPSYDGYETGDDPNRIDDGDLLAPVLLNVNVKIRSYAELRAARPAIEAALADVDLHIDITTATTTELEAVGRAFSILDGEDRPFGVGGTTLAKILHRKRPQLIPLYDRFVRDVYVTEDGPVRPHRGRSWAEFMTLLATQMQADINRDLGMWDRLTNLRPKSGPPLTRLRVLDILAWRIGRDGQLRSSGERTQTRSTCSRWTFSVSSGSGSVPMPA